MANRKNDNYERKLSYYYIGHFSKYIKPGAKRIANSSYTEDIEMTSFINSDNSIVVVIFNKHDYDIPYILNIGNDILKDNIKKHSILTYVINERK